MVGKHALEKIVGDTLEPIRTKSYFRREAAQSAWFLIMKKYKWSNNGRILGRRNARRAFSIWEEWGLGLSTISKASICHSLNGSSGTKWMRVVR